MKKRALEHLSLFSPQNFLLFPLYISQNLGVNAKKEFQNLRDHQKIAELIKRKVPGFDVHLYAVANWYQSLQRCILNYDPPYPFELCLPPIVKGDVYCFSYRQLIFSFGMRVIYHFKGL